MSHQRHAAFDSDDAAVRLELEAHAAARIDAKAIDRARTLRGGARVERILDLGCGPGVAAAALAEAFAPATVVAADNSPAMLERAAGRAPGLRTRTVDLDGDLAALGTFDVGWSSMAVHHARDELATLARFAALLRPGGVLVLLEHAAPTAARPTGDELGRPGIWDRLDAVRADRHGHSPGDPDAYPAALREAGLEVAADATLADTLDDARGPVVRRFAADRLRREARGFAERLDADDRAALERLPDPDAWHGVEVRISRRLLLARRPA